MTVPDSEAAPARLVLECKCKRKGCPIVEELPDGSFRLSDEGVELAVLDDQQASALAQFVMARMRGRAR